MGGFWGSLLSFIKFMEKLRKIPTLTIGVLAQTTSPKRCAGLGGSSFKVLAQNEKSPHPSSLLYPGLLAPPLGSHPTRANTTSDWLTAVMCDTAGILIGEKYEGTTNPQDLLARRKEVYIKL